MPAKRRKKPKPNAQQRAEINRRARRERESKERTAEQHAREEEIRDERRKAEAERAAERAGTMSPADKDRAARVAENERRDRERAAAARAEKERRLDERIEAAKAMIRANAQQPVVSVNLGTVADFEADAKAKGDLADDRAVLAEFFEEMALTDALIAFGERRFATETFSAIDRGLEAPPPAASVNRPAEPDRDSGPAAGGLERPVAMAIAMNCLETPVARMIWLGGAAPCALDGPDPGAFGAEAKAFFDAHAPALEAEGQRLGFPEKMAEKATVAAISCIQAGMIEILATKPATAKWMTDLLDAYRPDLKPGNQYLRHAAVMSIFLELTSWGIHHGSRRKIDAALERSMADLTKVAALIHVNAYRYAEWAGEPVPFPDTRETEDTESAEDAVVAEGAVGAENGKDGKDTEAAANDTADTADTANIADTDRAPGSSGSPVSPGVQRAQRANGARGAKDAQGSEGTEGTRGTDSVEDVQGGPYGRHMARALIDAIRTIHAVADSLATGDTIEESLKPLARNFEDKLLEEHKRRAKNRR